MPLFDGLSEKVNEASSTSLRVVVKEALRSNSAQMDGPLSSLTRSTAMTSSHRLRSDCARFLYCAAMPNLFMQRITDMAFQAPPRGAGMPRSVSSSAI